MTMTATSQTRVTNQTHGTVFHTPCFAFLETDFTTLTETELRQRIETFEWEFNTACPRDFARSVATGLAKKPNADTETRLEVVLREFSKPVVQEVVLRLNRDWKKFAPTVAALCVCGKDIRLEADQGIERAKAELLRRTAAA
jgi:hypothetical protein